MKIECPQCHKRYQIPEERLPKGKNIVFPCPNCKGRIKLALKPVPAAGASPGGQPPAPAEGAGLKAQLLKSIKDLPPMPQVVLKAQEIMADPDSNFAELSEVIKHDQGLVSKILRMANSSYFGLKQKVASVDHATVLLGQKMLSEIITMAGISKLMDNRLPGYDLDAGDLWRHAMAVAFGSKVLAERKNPALATEAFTAGLLHDAGKLILDPVVSQRKADFTAFMQDGGKTFLEAETTFFGFDHSEIAAEMCLSWNIPENLVVAIRHHHRPSGSSGNELAYILHMADNIATQSGIGIGSDDILYQLEPGTMDYLGIDKETVNEIMFQVMESNARIGQ